MGGVVVHDEVQVQILRRFRVEVLEKGDPLAVGVPTGGLADNAPVQIGEGGEEGDGPVAGIVVGGRPDVSHAQG